MLAERDDGYSTHFDTLIDARVPKVFLSDSQCSLYNNMLDQELIHLHKNTDPQRSYAPGCLAMTSEGFTLDGHGDVNRDIAVTGTPTEGVTFDNDTLARNRNNVVSTWAAYVRRKCSQPIVKKHGS